MITAFAVLKLQRGGQVALNPQRVEAFCDMEKGVRIIMKSKDFHEVQESFLEVARLLQLQMESTSQAAG